MASNHILINGSMEYSVSDGKIDALLQWLNKNGYVANTGIKIESDEICVDTTSHSQIEA